MASFCVTGNNLGSFAAPRRPLMAMSALTNRRLAITPTIRTEMHKSVCYSERQYIRDRTPGYDVSSAVGTKLSKDLAFGIGGQRLPARIGAPQWVEHARRCKIDSEEALAAVAEVAEVLPDAFAQAIQEAKGQDENIEQRIVNERAGKTLRYVQARCAEFERSLARARHGAHHGQ